MFLYKYFFALFLLGMSSCTYSEHSEKVPLKTNIIHDTLRFGYDEKITGLKNLLTNEFIFKGHSSFIIAGNLIETEINNIIYNTIQKAEECFYNDYFEKKPDELITIFLFKDDITYTYWAEKLFGDSDLSPYGYYKPSDKAMLMNISTGGGTLIHELTHAFVRYDFPDIPSWLNEGLGSLYERCSLSGGNITGYVNWRLPGLQKAINNKTYTSLTKLVNTTDDEFYGDNSGFNYAQARYLCYYLQENGLLKKFYKTFRDRYEEDKTGKKFLEEILKSDLKSFDSEFKKFVLSLELID
ncbi:MAG: hypothetical protein JW917_03835 [Ignavibacteria bacterium]|nr:hypothetical protein [Ignavibacteria bacterium]